MTPLARCFSTAVAVLTVISLTGCSDGKKYASVSGTVTHKGQPLAGATVVFTPDPFEAGASPATAVTGADGTFQLQTNLPGGKTQNGVPPGKYKVTASKLVPPKGMSEAEYEKKVAAAAAGPYSPNAVLAKVELLPDDYASTKSTKVTATVTDSGPNEVKIAIP